MTYLYDRIINVTFTNITDDSSHSVAAGAPSNLYTERIFSVLCSTQGIKPDITFSFSLIPGNGVYNVKVSIRNFCIDNKNVNIRNFTDLVLEAGYQGIGPKGSNRKNTISIPCKIFTSYQESPGPDGVTVFECVTVSNVTGFISDDNIKMTFNEDTVTLEEFITRCVKFAGGGRDDEPGKINIHNYLKKEYLSAEINVEKGTYHLANGYALIQKMTEILTGWGKTVIKKEKDAKGNEVLKYLKPFVNLSLEDIYIMALDPYFNEAVNEEIETKEEVIDLKAVTSASFSGPTLTVIAPWNPKLLPEKLFVMPPNFINGSKLPNLIGDSIYKNPDNYYRVLTMDIKFSTVGRENQMSVMAIPVQYASQKDAEAVKKATVYEAAAIINRKVVSLEFGNKEEISASYDENKTPMENMRAMADKIYALGGPGDVIHKGDTLTSKAKKWYKDISLTFTKEDLQKMHGEINWRPKELKSKDGNTYSCGSEMLWPLIVLATLPLSRLSKDYLDINANFNPDIVFEGKKIIIPSITSLEDVKKQKDVFKWAWKWYIEFPEKASYGRTFKDIYWCLGGTDVD